jgi:hypothetical protein
VPSGPPAARTEEALAPTADEADLATARRLRAAIDLLAFTVGASSAARRLRAAIAAPPAGPADDARGTSLEARRDVLAASNGGRSDLLSSPAAPSDAVAVINSLATGTVLTPRLGLDGAGRVVGVPPESSIAVALARVAVDAIELLTSDELLRVCAADDCGIRFVDRSPAGNRRWCSMRRCGNRTKARRHYGRARGPASSTYSR